MTSLNLREQAKLGAGAANKPVGAELSDVSPAGSGQRMELIDFYRAVLPEGGRYILFQNKRHTSYPTLETLTAATEQRINTQGLYFATAAFGDAINDTTGDPSRAHSNVTSLAAHRIDIDAGDAKFASSPNGAYPTQDDAIAALMVAIRGGLPKPTLIVKSGEGLHCYWSLTEAQTPMAWRPAAVMLNAAGKALNLKIDAGCTADVSRVLRPVGTLHKNGKRVEVLRNTGARYDSAALLAQLTALVPEAEAFELQVASSPRSGGINDDILSSGYKGPPASLVRVAEFCPAVAEMRDTHGNIPEPHWRAVIGIAKYCDDGQSVFHEWSSGYAGYDAQETQQKMDRWETPPSKCTFFGTLTDACKGCEYKGKITTPKELGYESGAIVASRINLKALMPDWKCNIEGEKVRALDTTANLDALAKALGNEIRYNVMLRKTEIIIPGLKTERDDLDNASLAYLGDAALKAGMSRRGIKELADAVAGKNPFHPAQEWVYSLPWDGVSRRELLYNSLELLNSSQSPLRASVVDAWMLQCIGALESPDGIAAQGVLVLAGPQGTNKTRWCGGLCPLPGAVRTGLHLNPQDKDSVFQATSCWVAELGELDHTTRRSDVSALKAFIDRPEDILRRPYALTDNVYRRRTIFVGTVNGTGFLADDTGDRRFWVLSVRRCKLIAPDEMQQIWAEYLALYKGGQRWFLDEPTKAALNESNAGHRLSDPLHERIQTGFDWSKASTGGWHEASGVRWASATDVCLQVGVLNPNRSDVTRAGVVVRKLNGDASRRSNGLTLLALPPRAEFRS